jgi:hypothetical protein
MTGNFVAEFLHATTIELTKLLASEFADTLFIICTIANKALARYRRYRLMTTARRRATLCAMVAASRASLALQWTTWCMCAPRLRAKWMPLALTRHVLAPLQWTCLKLSFGFT